MNSVMKATNFLLMASFAYAMPASADFSQAEISKKLASVKGVEHSVLFTRVSDGTTLFESNAEQLLSPASVTKIVTSAAALANFGPAYSFKTPMFYSGKFNAGTISGNLYLRGNGDPFVVSEVLWQMAIDLRHIGVREITGNVVLDQSLFDQEDRDESRKNSTQKSTHAYDAPISAFAANFNTVAVATAPMVAGRPALSMVTPFPLAHVKLGGKTQTVKGEQSNQVTLSRNSTADGGVSLVAGGNIGADADLKKLYRSVGDPNVSAGDYVIGFLREAGIKVRGKSEGGKIPDSAKKLYEISGYEMRRIVQGLNTFSNNFIADMLTKRLGAAFAAETSPDQDGSGTLANGVKVLKDFLRNDAGIRTPFTILNGSGLATENRLSANQIVAVLNSMEKRGDLFPDFLASLPANGWDGTLKKRMKKSDSLAGMIRAKSGTLTEPITVAALAGYFRHPKEGWVSFAIISNGKEGRLQPSLQDVRYQQDDVLRGILDN
jgi:D-alanyl-D-alanine carboxypeptidase/D-alanyl-D-alanine-endopeptidase (penicillin-binding protein 4)